MPRVDLYFMAHVTVIQRLRTRIHICIQLEFGRNHCDYCYSNLSLIFSCRRRYYYYNFYHPSKKKKCEKFYGNTFFNNHLLTCV